MGVYVCDVAGNDDFDGSPNYPFKTIKKASSVCKPGTTVIVKPGIYRERIVPIKSGTRDKKITYKSFVKHQAIIRGSIPWLCKESETIFINEELTDTITILRGPLDLSLFTDNSQKDGNNPFLIPQCVTPFGREGKPESKIKSIKNSDPNMVYTLGQVFANDIMYIQCPTKEEMYKTKKSWFYDKEENMLYVSGDAADLFNIEITNQRRLFAPHKRGLKNIVIDGFVFERCGNQYPNKFWSNPNNQQAGAVGTRCGKFWIIKNNVISWANGIGIDWGNEGRFKSDIEKGFNGNATGSYGHIIENNIISDNGAAGTAAFMANKFEFHNNVIERNNNLRFKGKQRWESAGVKIHKPKNSIISNNLIRDNFCHGIWSDQGAGINTYYKNNIIYNNKGSGIEFEIGQNTSGNVVNNIFNGNDYGVRFSASGGALITHNLFIKSKISDIKTLIYKRDKDKWDSTNVKIYYNMFMSESPQYIQLTPYNDNPNMLSTRYLNYNTYHSKQTDKKFQLKFNWKKTIDCNFNDWKKLLSDTNNTNNINCDENSEMLLPESIRISMSITENRSPNNKLTSETIKLNNTLHYAMSSYLIENEKMGSQDDYLEDKWSQDGYCIAGPFMSLDKDIILWSS